MSDKIYIIIGCLVSSLVAATITISLLYMSDRVTQKATIRAHNTVVENQAEIHVLETHLQDIKQELRVCIEKGDKK